jgi:bacterioferritin
MTPKSTSPKASSEVMDTLSKIFQAEMAGIIRYLHYSFMIMGHNRIPIQKWFRDNANEASAHAITIGEKITSLGGHPPVISSKVEEMNNHSVQGLLEESLKYEMETLEMYKKLVSLCGDDIALEEMARELVRTEQEHVDEVQKMLRSSH